MESDNYAQAFTTGDNSPGYVIESVALTISGNPTVSLYEADGSGNPGTKLFDFTNPVSIVSGGDNEFAAPANSRLRVSTTYLVVVDNGGNTGTWHKAPTSEDEGGAAGWSIADSARFQANRAGNWAMPSLGGAAKLRVNGVTRVLPTSSNQTVTTTPHADIRYPKDSHVPYTFSAADFHFRGTPGYTLVGVKITELESAGDLTLDGVDVTLGQLIAKADIDTGKLRYTLAPDAHHRLYSTFRFKVNDGFEDSASDYVMRLVTPPARRPSRRGARRASRCG